MAMTALPNALRSHSPLSFCTKPSTQHDNIQNIATRLQFISNHKLRSEASREEPSLRQLLGHIAVYDDVRVWHMKNAASTTSQSDDVNLDNTNELSDYLHQVPSFQEFQAAIQDQLATMAEVSASVHQMTIEDYEIDSDEDCEYDSYDGEDWSDDETSTESDDSSGSLTDGELAETESCSRSSTPSSERLCDGDYDDKLETAILQPLSSFTSIAVQL